MLRDLMNMSHTSTTYRAITIIALIQAGVVVGGTLFVAAMLKYCGYDGSTEHGPHYPSGVLFVRHFGFTLIFVPAVWTLLAVLLARTARRRWLLPALLIVGIAAILCGILMYFMFGILCGLRGPHGYGRV